MKKVILLSLLPFTAMAASTSIKGIGEIYQDWDLICDNTGTCRMAGYQENRDDPVSILFTREAGENTPVEGELTILPFGENDRDIQVGQDIEIWLNDKSLGTIKHISDSNPDKLSEEQTKAILSGLTKESEIRLTYGKTTLRVSDRGAAAVMLRMDEFQQRLNTPSALIRQGQEKHAVLAPQTAPKIEVASVNNRKKIGLKRGEKQYDNVLALLRKAYNGCKDEDEVSQDITLYPLTQNKVLAKVLCVRGAYQRTNYYAVLDDKLSKVEQILAGLYNEAGYDEKQGYAFVRGTYKGRGLGDCLGGQDAAWNGKIFIRTSKWTTGSCKGFGGGAWQLPIFVSDIVVK